MFAMFTTLLLFLCNFILFPLYLIPLLSVVVVNCFLQGSGFPRPLIQSIVAEGKA